MKRPLVSVALCYISGLLLGEFFQPPLRILFAATFCLVFAALFFAQIRSHLIWPMLLFLGWTNLVSRTAVLTPADLRVALNAEPALVRIQGELVESPRIRVRKRGEQESWRSLAQVRVTEIEKNDAWRPAFGDIVVTTPDALPEEFFAGRKVKITGLIKLPPEPVAEGLFDYRSYLERKGIYYLLEAQQVSDWQIIETENPKSPPLSDLFRRWARNTLALGLPPDDEATRLIAAMTLGWKSALTDEVAEPFMRSGTLHIFAISGLHVALVAGILLGLLRAARLPREWCGLIVIPLLWFYASVTGWQPSAVRASVMMSVVLFGWSLRRPGDLLNSLFAAAFIILLWDPRQLFQASFQLSFSVVLSLALVLPRLEKLRLRWWPGDPLLPAELRPRWQRWIEPPAKWLVRMAATSFAAWLGSLPLAAYYFHLFTPVSLLANIVIVPLSGLALTSSMASLLTGAWFPSAVEVFNNSAWFWMNCMIVASRWCAALPGAFCYVAIPTPALLTLYYTLLITGGNGWLFSRQYWKPALGVVALLFCWNGWQWAASRNTTCLDVIPLNGGRCIYMHNRESGNRILIDCGNSNSVSSTTAPFLQAHGVNRLPALALTHGDIRYAGGAGEVFSEFGKPIVLTSPLRFRSTAYRTFVEDIASIADKHHIVEAGDELSDWTVLFPKGNDEARRADDGAMVLQGTFDGITVLALSDLSPGSQDILLQRHPDLRADIVISGLPSRGEPLLPGLLERINPRLIIVADSNYPATRRASRELIERLKDGDVPVFFTHETGGLSLRLDRCGWEIRVPDGSSIERQEMP